ncbi:hypothetical protein NA57DRAFT_77686 [Rhizodiscina lignyota]|uniref:Uncharacterized protein n=1 Tax=Rhizodiscina lignyota TaxID=1504668 RepID=A0A9P4ICE5_9PEZI|nr:hypothetical protein NA57DRAFT_77686 [Rhizodiscina lignyota]
MDNSAPSRAGHGQRDSGAHQEQTSNAPARHSVQQQQPDPQLGHRHQNPPQGARDSRLRADAPVFVPRSDITPRTTPRQTPGPTPGPILQNTPNRPRTHPLPAPVLPDGLGDIRGDEPFHRQLEAIALARQENGMPAPRVVPPATPPVQWDAAMGDELTLVDSREGDPWTVLSDDSSVDVPGAGDGGREDGR